MQTIARALLAVAVVLFVAALLVAVLAYRAASWPARRARRRVTLAEAGYTLALALATFAAAAKARVSTDSEGQT